MRPSAAARSGRRSLSVPTVEIDGRKVEVPDGHTVMQAAERLGI